MHDDMQVVAHNRTGVNTAGENLAQLQNACLDPRLSMLETFAEVFIQATQPRSTYAAVDAMKRSGLRGVNKLAAGLGHRRSLGVRALLENQIGRNLGSDLSEGWVSALNIVLACSSMIGQDVDWSKVQVWSTNYLPFQGSNVLTPNGENMYWGRNYMEDVTQDFGELARMVHECVHIWQGQTSGTNVIKRRGSYDYSSYLRRGQGWNQMGIEAQADIVTDLFLRLNRYGPQYGNPVGYSPA